MHTRVAAKNVGDLFLRDSAVMSEDERTRTEDRQCGGGQRIAVRVGGVALHDQVVLFGDVTKHQTVGNERQLVVVTGRQSVICILSTHEQL